MTTNDRQLIQISADSRALIRAEIKRNPGWKAYAEAHDCDLGTLTTRDAIFDCCDALGIDVSETIGAGPRPAVNTLELAKQLSSLPPRRRPETPLECAREDFMRFGDRASCAALLEAALEAWNDEKTSDLDLIADVRSVQLCLARAESPAAS